jgi:hypothetical protein
MMSKYKIVYSEKAKVEISIAKAWYNVQLKGLGLQLIEEIKSVSKSILLNPYFASIKYKNTHIAFCKKFPYGIHYKIDEVNKIIFVTSIFHQSQQPFWEI